MEVYADPPPKTHPFCSAWNRVCADVEPGLAKHEVLLVGVCARLVAWLQKCKACVAASNASPNKGSLSMLQAGAFGVSMPIMMQSSASWCGQWHCGST
jgi:hypothetical protein